MAKKKRASGGPSGSRTPSGDGSVRESKPATLSDLLDPAVLNKLKAQANSMKEAERQKAEEERTRAEEARKAEQKRKENDFAYLLENSKDWGKYT